MLGGLAMMQQIGFAVSIGISIAAFIMSMFLVPAFTALMGAKAWWPGHKAVVSGPGDGGAPRVGDLDDEMVGAGAGR